MADDTNTPPDQVSGCAHPIETERFLGDMHAVQSLDNAIKTGQLHHAWLLEGPRGIGKASLTYLVARRLLGVPKKPDLGTFGYDTDNGLNRQILAGSCADLLVLSPDWDERAKKWRASITVDQIRKTGSFFAQKASGLNWKVCIIDAVDEMNTNGLNALLKTLEEPPEKGVLLLISHNTGYLPDTIYSRCRKLTVRPPKLEDAAKIIRQFHADSEEATLALKLANASAGRAMEILGHNGLQHWKAVSSIIEASTNDTHEHKQSLLGAMARNKPSIERQLVFDLLLIKLRQEIQRISLAGASPKTVQQWLRLYDLTTSLFADIDRINLDPSMTLEIVLMKLGVQISKTGKVASHDN